MPERISNEAFFDEIRNLGPGDVAHHSMLYPGVYPSDREAHEQAKQGFAFETTGVFYDAAQTALNNGARLEWLRVMPTIGEFGYDPHDITAMRRNMGAVAKFGFDVRVVDYGDHAPRIVEHCDESPVVRDFLQGLEVGDPRKSSWAIFKRQQAGKLVLEYLDTMDYVDGEFTGHVRHHLPVDEHTAKWTFSWRDAYDRYGEPISPQDS